MFKQLVRLGLVLLVLNIFVTSCESNRDYDRNYEGLRYEIQTSRKFNFAIDPDPSRGLGLSAWGIIALIVSIILAIVGMYYFSICYPVLCQKSKKYDIMELPPPV